MLGYTLRRLIQVVFTLFALTVLIFLLLKLMPGDPAVVMAGIGARLETIEGIREELGLNRPWPVQYWRFISGLFTGSLRAMTYHTSVWTVIFQRLAATVELGIFAMTIALVVSIPAGLLSAIYRNSVLDYTVTTVALVGISIPVFWFALMLMLIFGVVLRILPVSGRGTSIVLFGWDYLRISFVTWDGFRHLIIPSVALASVQMAMNARLTRASMLEVLRQVARVGRDEDAPVAVAVELIEGDDPGRVHERARRDPDDNGLVVLVQSVVREREANRSRCCPSE